MQFLVFSLSLLTIAYAAPHLELGRTLLTGQSIDGRNVDFFGGIPFAEPPVGQLRFRPPVLKTQLASPSFDASNFGKSCLQPPSAVNLTENMSEDCLTINVYKPATIPKNTKLPVLFWTYGGAWAIGTSAMYDGSDLVARSVERGTPVIYVSFNYRLGPFGWPQSQEAEDKGILNLGLQDQLTALKWVQRNVHYFGGDKDKVTAFGESAGSIMTAILYLDDHIKGLARAAIFESGQASSIINPKASFREDAWINMVKGVPSCASTATSGATISCLRRASASEIYAGWLGALSQAPPEFILYFPTIDPGSKSVFRELPSLLYSRGQFARLPFIAGANLDEGTYFALRGPNTTESDVKRHILSFNSPTIVPEDDFQRAVDRVLELYPDIPSLGSPFNTGDELFGLTSLYKRHAAILGDMIFDGPRRTWMRVAASHGVKVYGYQFTQPQPLDDPSLGAYHSSEIAFVYGQPRDQSPSARNLSTTMMDYWISFAVTLDPNDKHGSNRPVWPRYQRSNEVLLQLNGSNTTTIEDNYRQDRIDFFETNPIVFRH